MRSTCAWLCVTYTQSWEFWFGLLQRFAEREGHSNVPHKHRESGHPLGSWVNVQRRFRKSSMLLKERAERLEGVPGWSWDANEAAWQEGYSVLVAYAQREGSGRVPEKHVEGDFRLGSWAQVQRGRHRAGELAEHRRRQLEAVPGWVWEMQDLEGRWKERYERLCRFARRKGHTSLSSHCDALLSQWVSVQRTRYAKGKLSATRVVALESVPAWEWDPGEARWMKYFGALEKFVSREGHARVPQAHREGTVLLGGWVLRQRQAFQADDLSHDRAMRLEALPGWLWEAQKQRQRAAWEQGFSVLQRFAKREGHTSVPQFHQEGEYPLGQWMAVQRQTYRNGRLAADRAHRLETLPRWSWAPDDVRWEAAFALLQRFVEREGDAGAFPRTARRWASPWGHGPASSDSSSTAAASDRSGRAGFRGATGMDVDRR